jgi:hypothetical protein
MEEHCRILGVTADDGEDYINQRYRELSQLWHPDKCGRFNFCSNERKLLYTEQQQLINEAYRKLKSQVKKRSSSQSKKYRSVDIGSEEIAIHDIFVVIVGVLSIYAALKVFISSGRNLSALESLGTIFAVSVSSLAVYAMRESEHIDTVMWSISPIFAYIAYQLIRDLLKLLKYLVHASREYLITLMALPLAYHMVTNGLPRMAAVVMWLCMVTHWKVFDSRALLFCSMACFWFIRSPSMPNIVPMQELINEALLLRIYASVFVLTRLCGDYSMHKLALNFYVCIEKGNCSGHSVSNMVQTLASESSARIFQHLMGCIQYTPHLLIAVALWYVLAQVFSSVAGCYQHLRYRATMYFRGAYKSSHPGPTMEKSEVGGGDDAVHEQTGGVRAGERIAFEHKIDILTDAVDGLSRADAAEHLQAKEGDVEAVLAHLQTPAGKASRAAQARRRKPLEGAATRGSYLKTSSSTASIVSTSREPIAPPSIIL